ncbi:TonB-dependent receptor [Hahella sp. KA22]|uniref:TonB-dependent receptor domain-containing protein n=1 Tax=Hahella sp. KA22 TaxID=1628392 RepID=UPI000FDDF289|nr:TonB-dependent receptor [Hahella sp. KA22]AZZ94132.1 TonB-dependent receptor [Hahella sp. KA22]QAY57506.1 TonB-dependent receptor [Hahella sp. KA22]
MSFHVVRRLARSAHVPFPPAKLPLALRCASLAVALAPVAGVVQAEESTNLAPVTVWGTEVSSSSVYLGEEDISIKQADHLSDLLRDQPGVEVGGTHSVNQRINIRGLDDTDLDIRIDGASQSNFMYHHMGNLLINADILKAVDIQVGANSIVHGGLGGGVKFETKDAKDLLKPGRDFGGRVSFSHFTNDATQGSLTGYGKLGDSFDFLAYMLVNDRDNPKDGDGVENVGNDGKIKDHLIKLGYDIGEYDRLEFGYGAYRDEGDYTYRPDMGPATNTNIPGSSLPYPTEYNRDTYTLNYDMDRGDMLNLRLSLSHNVLDLRRDESIVSGGIIEGEAINSGANATAQTLTEAFGLEHLFTYGSDILRQQGVSNKDGEQLTKEKALNIAVFAEDRATFDSGLAITPGVRVDRYNLDSVNADKTYTEVSGALAAEMPVTDALTVRVSTTQTFKGPELSEIFNNAGGIKTPNPDIRPEDGHNEEFGVNYFKPDVWGAKSIAGGVTLYRTKIHDVIQASETSDMDENVGTAVIDGYEASFKYSLTDLSLMLTYASMDSEVRRHDGSTTPLDREIGDTIGVIVTYYVPSSDLTFDWNAQFVSEEDNVAEGSENKDGYQVHNVSMQWQPKGQLDGVAVTFGIENLFDERYTAHASRTGRTNHPVFGELLLNDYEPGRNYKLTLAYSF